MRFISFAAAALVLMLPLVVFGQEVEKGLVTCSGPDCDVCDVVQTANNLIRLLIQIGLVVGVLLFAYGGFIMVTSAGNQSQVGKAKSIFLNVVIGFVILLGAWLIVDTIMKTFAKGDQRFGTWNELTCPAQPVQPTQQAGGSVTPTTPATTTTPGTGGGTQTGQPAEGQLAHADAVQRLRDAGITVTSTAGANGVKEVCSSGTGCTSLQGLREQTVQQALALKTACPTCNVMITGATEPGHAAGEISHGTGYKLDIQTTPSVNEFIESNLTRSGSRPGAHGGPRYVDSCGNEYVKETSYNHWDITVNKGTCSY